MPRPGSSPAIVVGVDGSENGLKALAWALEEAGLRGCPVRMIHAFQPTHGRGRGGRRSPARSRMEQMYEEGTAVFDAARARLAEHRHERLLVGTALYEGAPAQVLIDLVSRARMCVVGRRGRGGIANLLPGSTSMSLGVHARVPVVIVPADWPEARPPSSAPVVVGVDLPLECETALEFAFEEAQLRGAPLLVVSAWEIVNPYVYNLRGLQEAVGERRARVDRMLAETLAPWREKYPQVAVRVVAEQSHPTATLVAHSAGAQLLVLGGRARPRNEIVTGSVTRAVLRRVGCPVAVIHDPVNETGGPAVRAGWR
ncbi:universal stress protein [Actinopolymorpha pittospori]|uniref:Nucleotide-binding universal stress UspA family protein n=1 Tax=Actinopolymorpha pittospori TaxID=648752 RepID=A0A927N763_9ACTN|nr:universal stress protein [Actinopolymorpha pittospori]MBE1609730.1 nucleotide-binding universal stress UspA family protein [Actinopolymorpha pittospori]